MFLCNIKLIIHYLHEHLNHYNDRKRTKCNITREKKKSELKKRMKKANEKLGERKINKKKKRKKLIGFFS